MPINNKSIEKTDMKITYLIAVHTNHTQWNRLMCALRIPECTDFLTRLTRNHD